MELKHLPNLIADFVYGIQGSHGFLKYHRNSESTNVMHFISRQRNNLLFFEKNLPPKNFPNRLGQQPHNGKRRDALSTSGLTYQAQGMAPFHGKGNAFHGTYQTGFRVKCGYEIVNG
jgi:hypothetical protein